jgi:hypothetical protein
MAACKASKAVRTFFRIFAAGGLARTDARTDMRAEGICGFVSYRGQENDRYIYSIGNLSPYSGFDL